MYFLMFSAGAVFLTSLLKSAPGQEWLKLIVFTVYLLGASLIRVILCNGYLERRQATLLELKRRRSEEEKQQTGRDVAKDGAQLLAGVALGVAGFVLGRGGSELAGKALEHAGGGLVPKTLREIHKTEEDLQVAVEARNACIGFLFLVCALCFWMTVTKQPQKLAPVQPAQQAGAAARRRPSKPALSRQEQTQRQVAAQAREAQIQAYARQLEQQARVWQQQQQRLRQQQPTSSVQIDPQSYASPAPVPFTPQVQQPAFHQPTPPPQPQVQAPPPPVPAAPVDPQDRAQVIAENFLRDYESYGIEGVLESYPGNWRRFASLEPSQIRNARLQRVYSAKDGSSWGFHGIAEVLTVGGFWRTAKASVSVKRTGEIELINFSGGR